MRTWNERTSHPSNGPQLPDAHTCVLIRPSYHHATTLYQAERFCQPQLRAMGIMMLCVTVTCGGALNSSLDDCLQPFSGRHEFPTPPCSGIVVVTVLFYHSSVILSHRVGVAIDLHTYRFSTSHAGA
ncbi:hypothetical protein K432DRAFT_177838 [Lepidopterella palustris CBS 459.81]|uniref:Uncharacterized protein n=1 Tax=Lepidopterella palustris CBS 459.81 TaxID=1314670 RepID=A0A8E2E102_9PEZI|nr:hypothetical protein K432DRAFT_177838 [Lepidopterella palustris CBS 459.81]